MDEAKKNAAPTSASPEEDPNAAIVCNSPPCFMHELEPSYLGYFCRREVSALLGAVLAAEWGGAVPDEARRRAALRRHLGVPADDRGRTQGEPSKRAPDEIARMIRGALPRIHGDALRRDLEAVPGALGGGVPQGGGPRDEG